MDALNEQINGYIHLDGSLQPLPILDTWKRASSVFWIRSESPFAAMNFKVGKADKSGFYDQIPMVYHIKRGLWRVYVPSTQLRVKCETAYKIVAVDEYNNRTVCGEGLLRVHSGMIDDPDDSGIDKDECYAKFPDGLWRRVTVYTDSAGELAFTVDNNGHEAAEFDDDPKQPYAYNKTNGKYYEVLGFVDAAGEAYISIRDAEAESGTVTYSKDLTTGFYYRVETMRDEAGDLAPVVGDKKE